ncbi:MAG: glucosamine-6-phosphate deaminase [Planctomycetes bacterium]|nr:glucosamine-6-phosphate deaminase [Planctomycetota bacterium]
MEIVLTNTPEEATELVASLILDCLGEKPDLVLGLATGSTPIGVYRRLVEAYRRGEADFFQVRTFNLDEYLDLPAEHPQSYRSFMWRHLFDHINIPRENVHFPPSEGANLLRRCEDYDKAIAGAGGIDIQLLGIGSNGHIGFNEPTSSLRSRTRIKTLTEKTLSDNSRFYKEGEIQPGLAVTMGIGTILDARQILLQAFGSKKAEALRAAVEGPVSSICPGSALQLHPRATLFLDPEAASLLRLREYYRRTRQNEEALRRQGRL